MKKYIYLLIMALIAVSCTETDVLQNNPTNGLQRLNAKITKAESRAIWEPQPLSWEGLDMVNSRTYAVPEGDGKKYYHQYWSIGDEISYFKTTKNLKYISSKVDAKEDEYITYFTQSTQGEGEPLATEYNYGVYPYKEDTQIATDGTVTFTFPEEQLYCKDSYANGHNFMIGRHKSEDQVLEFLNFCSYIKFQLKSDVNKDVDKIVLKANNQQDFMTGVGTIAFNAEGYPEVTMDHERSFNHLVLNCREEITKLRSDSITNFWFVLPGNFTFTEGFTITVSFTDGTYFKKSTKENLGPIKIERNHIQPIAELPLPSDSLKTSVIRYKYESQPTTLKDAIVFPNNSFKDEDGNSLTPHTTFDSTTGIYEVNFDGHLYSIEQDAFYIEDKPNINWIKINNSTAIEIASQAFQFSTADSIIFNNDIISINQETFAFSDAKIIKINGDIHTINTASFAFCYSLDSIKVTGEIENISYQGFATSTVETVIVLERVTNIENQAFYSCTSLKNIKLPKVEHIGDKAFYGCSNMDSIDLCAVHQIGESAFAGCVQLKEVCISKDCISIGNNSFANLRNLKTIYIYASEPPVLELGNNFKLYTVFPANATIHIPEGSLKKYQNANDYWKTLNLKPDITEKQIADHYGH